MAPNLGAAFKTGADVTESARRSGFSRTMFESMASSASKIGGKVKNLFSKSGVVKSTDSIAAKTTSEIDEAVVAAKTNPEGAARSMDDGLQVGDGAKRQPGSQTQPDSGKGVSDADTLAKRNEIVRTKTGLSTTSKVLGGISVAGIITYAAIVVDSTDGVTATVTNIEIDSTKNYAFVDYVQPNDIFSPTEGDTINLSANCGLGAGSYDIVEVISATRIKINITNLTPKPPSSGVYCTSSPCPSGRTFTCHSDFGNQFASAIGNTVSVVTDSLGAAVGAAVDSAGNVIDRTITAATPALTNLAGAAGGAAKTGFCAAIPFLCSTSTWLIILLLAIGMIIFVAVS
jgi:hypothetical protein